MFRKLIAGVILSVCAMTAIASTTVIDTKGLSEAQVAELKSLAAKAVADVAKNAETPVVATTPSTVMTIAATWGTQAAQAAEGFAKAINIAAKELGVTVNDFLHTDAGILTAALIIWKVAGTAIAHMLYGFLFLTIGLTFIRVLYVRLFTREYKELPFNRLFGLWSGVKLVRVPKTIGQLETDGEWFAFWVLMFATIGVLWIGGAFF